jgi:DNA-directed RNA polymerase specialized sigma24 family protein
MDRKTEFAVLYREQRKRLVRLVCRWGATSDEAHEIVQDSFQALWEKLLNDESIESERAFLLTVSRHKTINLLKSSYYGRREFREDLDDWVAESEDLGSARLREGCVQEKLTIFELDNPVAGYAIQMQLDGVEVAKIAEAISRSAEATRQYLYQIKKKLKRYLEECREY